MDQCQQNIIKYSSPIIQICNKLAKVEPDNDCKFTSKNQLARVLGCKNIQLDSSKAVEMIEKKLNTDSLIMLFYGFSSVFSLDLQRNPKIKNLIRDQCHKLDDFYDTRTGLTRSERKKTVFFSSFRPKHLFRKLSICLKSPLGVIQKSYSQILQ